MDRREVALVVIVVLVVATRLLVRASDPGVGVWLIAVGLPLAVAVWGVIMSRSRR